MIMTMTAETMTFMDVANRERCLETAEGKYLLNQLPAQIAEKFRDAFLNTGLTGGQVMDVLSYLIGHSTITRIVKAAPSSAETFEYLYRKRPVDNEIDEYFIRAKAAIGIYERLVALKNNLPEIIRDRIAHSDLGENDKYTIFNIGSGPGHDMIEVLDENPDLRSRVHVVCIDPDAPMIALGQQRVEELGMSGPFTFIPEKFGKTNIGAAHMILMIGIFCPMPSAACVKTLGSISHFLLPGGTIIFNTVQSKMLQEDPLTDFIMRLLGWNMDYKENGQSIEIAREAGLEPVSSFFDSLGFNQMVVARKI